MKKLKYFKLFVASGLLLVAASCSNDFLEVEPFGKFQPETYYQTDAEAVTGTYAAYDMLSSDQFQGWSSPMLTRVLIGDETNCGGGGVSDQPQYQSLDKYEWQTDNAGIKAYYSKGYYGVYRCNAIVSNCKPDSPLKIRSVAEAKFLRAFYLFELTTAFGDIPMPLVNAESLDQSFPKVSQANVYNQIIKDLTDAIADLPYKSTYSAVDKFRANKLAAQALLGKVYLYMGDNAKAITTLDAVIAQEGANEVGLEPDFSKITFMSTEFGIESLFEANFAKDNRYWGNDNWDRTADDNRHIQLSGPRSLSYDTLSVGPPVVLYPTIIHAGWGFFPPRKAFYNALDAADPRKALTVVTTAEFRATYHAVFTNGWDTEDCIRTKYTTYASETSGEPALNYGTNWRLIRYADVLLMAAEAYFKNGDATVNSVAYINKVRVRAGAPTISTVTFDLIVKERQIELAYEGHRYNDLMRWNKEGRITDAELITLLGSTWSVKNKLFPIPLDEMTSNSEIGSQNPGY